MSNIAIMIMTPKENMFGENMFSKNTFVLAVIFICFVGTANAGGLYFDEQANASNISYGGIAFNARANDAGTVFANPAGMSRFDEPEKMVGGSLLYMDVDFKKGSDNTISGRNGNTTEWLTLANGAYIRPLNDKWTFGVSAQNYFGLALNWHSQWSGRYVVNQVILVAPQIQPTLSYKVNDSWYVGAGLGLTLGYIKDKKSDVADGPGDGKFKYRDQDFAVQPNLGVMFEPSDKTRVGLRYLFETDLDFNDDPAVTDPDGNDSGNSDKLQIGMVMPQQLALSGWQRVSTKWAVLADVNWEDWSRFGEINIGITGDGLEGATTVHIATEDTYHVGIGAEYQSTPKLMYTMGASWDSSWQRDKNRTAIVPIGTIYRIGGGFKYKKTEDVTLGAGLSLFYQGNLPVASVDNADGDTFAGEYRNVYMLWSSFYVSWK
jgi:long-chain fatty acid transport protein